MCILEPPTPITAAPNALTDSSFPADNHFESLLVCATIISNMGNIQPPPPPSPSPRPSDAASSTATAAFATNSSRTATAQLAMFILGGPMPPTPGLIPLCWEDLIDWTTDATAIAEQIHDLSTKNEGNELYNFLPAVGEKIRGIRFVPLVSLGETETALKKLASLSYMDRAQFYQESVVVAIKSEEDEEVLCLISLFQFCRYFTLIRRLLDSQSLILEYQQPFGASDSSVAPPKEDDNNDELGVFLENDGLVTLPKSTILEEDGQDCVICLEKAEDSVLHCCSQAICRNCERRWVRKRLRCPFCRQSFASVKEAVQTQWQLSSAIPVEQIVQDVHCLSEKVLAFWQGLGIDERRSESERRRIATFLVENYMERPKLIHSRTAEEGDDGFILVDG